MVPSRSPHNPSPASAPVVQPLQPSGCEKKLSADYYTAYAPRVCTSPIKTVCGVSIPIPSLERRPGTSSSAITGASLYQGAGCAQGKCYCYACSCLPLAIPTLDTVAYKFGYMHPLHNVASPATWKRTSFNSFRRLLYSDVRTAAQLLQIVSLDHWRPHWWRSGHRLVSSTA
jgi:hypothetical protein